MIRASQYAGYPGVSVNGTVNVPMVGDLMILSYVNDYQYSGGDAVDMIDANGLLSQLLVGEQWLMQDCMIRLVDILLW